MVVQDKRGNTALHLACQENQMDVVKTLAAKMAPNLDPLNHSKTTPLHLACRGGWLDVVRFLLGQNVNFPTSATRDFMKGTDKTPLFALTESNSQKNQGEVIYVTLLLIFEPFVS